MQLASRFAHRSPVLRSAHPLSDDQIRTVAPSIFADTPHESRSERYSYIPTVAVLTELRKEGFQPFMVCQTRVRQEDRRDYTKHMLRLRHESQINGTEANEIILLNSHDGTSSYQMLAGLFRLWTAEHRRNYAQRRTMSSQSTHSLSQQGSLANNAVHSNPPCWACRPQGDHLGTNPGGRDGARPKCGGAAFPAPDGVRHVIDRSGLRRRLRARQGLACD